MCNRYNTPTENAIERMWHVGRHNSGNWPRSVFPRAPGPFIRPGRSGDSLELVLGQWGLIPWFAKSAKLAYSTNNARSEELAGKASFKQPWARGQRCIIPAADFDEPCWETGRNVWHTFRRADGQPWGLAGLWNAWTDPATGEVIESYSMLTANADDHPIMRRMHKPDPALQADQQDKRSVIAIEQGDVERWLLANQADVLDLLRPPPAELFA